MIRIEQSRSDSREGCPSHRVDYASLSTTESRPIVILRIFVSDQCDEISRFLRSYALLSRKDSGMKDVLDLRHRTLANLITCEDWLHKKAPDYLREFNDTDLIPVAK